jgi:hypothetical protein
VLPPSAFSRSWQRPLLFLGFDVPRLTGLRLQVFSTSWRFDLPSNLPALFHAGSALGVFPSELFPFVQPYAVSDALSLLSLESPLFPIS